LNTVYMVTYFLGGSLGSAMGAYGWTHWGWNGVCAAGAVQLLVALAVRSWMHFQGTPQRTLNEIRVPLLSRDR